MCLCNEMLTLLWQRCIECRCWKVVSVASKTRRVPGYTAD